MNWDALPRDLQIHILKKLDVDARIALGLVRKLAVPTSVVHRLEKVNTFKSMIVLNGGGCENTWILHAPYNNYLTDVGKHDASEWLDKWYELDWPVHRAWFLECATLGHEKYKAVEKLPVSLQYDRSGPPNRVSCPP